MSEFQLYLTLIGVLVLALIGTIAFGIFFYFGMFHPLEVSSGKPKFKFWGRKMLFKVATGHCWECSSLFTELTSILPNHVMVGIYMQLKKKTPEEGQETEEEVAKEELLESGFSSDFKPNKDRCKFLVGAFIEDDNGKVNLTDEQVKKLQENEYKCGLLPNSDNVVSCSFPYRGVFSIPIAIKRVYPKLMEYIAEHRLCAYPAMEIYDGDSIQFMFPLSQQADFLEVLDGASDIPTFELDSETEIDDEETEEEGGNDDGSESGSETGSASSFEKL